MKTSSDLISIIKERNSVKTLGFIDYLPSLIANIFSIIFSTSIIFELKELVSPVIMIILGVFIVLFLIQNEVMKVSEIRKLFSGNRNALLPFSISFIISISLATIGMYFYTNKSNEIKNTGLIEKNEIVTDITKKYQIQKDSILNISFEDTKEYYSINNELSYWKKAKAANLEERSELRTKVDKLQSDLVKQRTMFNENKTNSINRVNLVERNELNVIESRYNNKVQKSESNDFISYIFLSLILIVEFSTIYLNKVFIEKRSNVENFLSSGIVKSYLLADNMLTSLYLTAKNGNEVNVNNAKYSIVNKDNLIQWDEIKDVYNKFISMGILDEGEIKIINNGEKGSKILHNKLLLSENEAHEKLNNYYLRFFSIV
jgi:hypothetical protein